jgi:subtilisin-like proprotein convertase family protein
VTVEITHTYRGDLYVRLESPSGKSIVLHRDKGGSLDNLHLDLNSDQFTPLAELTGEDIHGEWKLRVSDLLKDDVGRLDTWGLTIDYESGEQVVTGSVEPNMDIPDMDENGIVSIISISETGKLATLSVDVDISHTYRGDLRIELISPLGGRALICDNNGDSADDIRQVYSLQSTPALKTLVGEEIRGDWRLHVRDLARDDQGTLNRWALSLHI